MQSYNRREVLVALAALGIPQSLWALQAGEELVDFSDYTAEFKVEFAPRNPRVRCFDLRQLTTWVTPNDQFYAFHQTETIRADASNWRLRVGGFVDHPQEFTLDQIKARTDKREEAVTLECSGNSTRPNRMSGLLSNAVWRGVGLASLLKECGIRPEAREVVFLGMDMETEKKFQAGNQEYQAPHARSIYVQDALDPEAMLAFEMNGQPLTADSGFPLRLMIPGWYGVAQVKWLTRIEVLDRRYEGQHMDRNYLSLKSVDTPDGPLWLDTSISRNNMKSVVARVTRRRSGAGYEYTISGAAWGGQIPINKVEVKVDSGDWRAATITEQHGKYAWILWSIPWTNPATGPHTLVSRAIDANGAVQPTTEELKKKIASGRESYGQWPRPITIA